ncbi:MAG: carboxypeptidase regulatory-like domain-containing protein [Fibrella sp.]|nr:carboxypeptidase regulatory-like domain-containing protein [Armatimonadota bacterium]
MTTIRFAMTAVVISVCGAAWAQAPIPVQQQNISGVVLGTDKKPVAGAKVYVGRWDPVSYETHILPPVPTDSDGRFTVVGQTAPTGAASGVVAIVYVDAPGYLFARVILTKGKPNEITLGVGSGVVRGSVVDAQGKPVAGVTIQVQSLQQDVNRFESYTDVPAPFAPRFKTRTDAAGKWEIRNVPATGRAYVSLDEPRYVAVSRQMTCVPDATATRTKSEPFLALPASAITGVVTLPDGKPAANIVVTARARGEGDETRDGTYGSGRTNADGTFRVGRIGKGTFTLTLASPDPSLLLPAQTGIVLAEGKEIALKPLALIAGTPVSGMVTDAKTGTGIDGLSLNVDGVHGGDSYPGNRMRTDKNGAFVVHVLPGKNTLQLWSRTSEYTGAGRTIALVVNKDAPVTLEPIRLQPAPVVRLAVTDEAGKPVPDLRLSVARLDRADDQGPQEWMGALTDESGAWDSKKQDNPALENDGSEYRIQVADNWEVVPPSDKPFRLIPDGKPLPVVVRRIDPAKRGVGRVVTPDGAPVADVPVSVVSERRDANGNPQDYQRAQTKTDAKGEYLFPPLKPGYRVEVSVGLDGHRGAINEGTPATENTPARVPDLVLVPLDGVLRGVVLRGKTPVAGAQVWSLDGERRTWARTDAKGAFVLKHVPGKGTVAVSASLGKSRASGTFTPNEKALLSLAPVAAPLLFGRVPLPPAIAKARTVRDTARAMELLRELSYEATPGVGVRNAGWGQDVLANLLSPVDFEAAVQIGRGADGKITDQAWFGIMDRRIAVDVEGAERAFRKQLPNFLDPNPAFYLSCSLGMAYAAKQPQKALEYYRLAAKTRTDNKLEDPYAAQRLAVLAYRLHLPDADANPAIESASGGAGKIPEEGVLIPLASGDGVRAAKRVDALPEEPRERRADVLYRIVEAMAPEQPLEARQLLDSIKTPGSEEAWLRGRAIVAIVKATVPFDPEAAYRLALTASSLYRAEALAHAASGITSDPALRTKRFLEATVVKEAYYRTPVLLMVAAIAEGSAPDAAATLRKQAREAIASKPDSVGGGVAIARVLLPEVPELCRRVIEIHIKEQQRNNPGHTGDYGMLRRELRTLALLDPDRALQIAGELKQKDAMFRMKADLALLLLTPPHKRLAFLERYP